MPYWYNGSLAQNETEPPWVALWILKLEKFTLAFPKDIAFFEPEVPKTGKAVIDSMVGKLIGHKKYDPPLSWKLSKKQKSYIEGGWKTLLEGGAESELYQLKALWDKRDAG